jgi:hypothetical protein
LIAFLFLAPAWPPTSTAAEPSDTQGERPPAQVIDAVRTGMFILGARYGTEAVCHWPAHHDLEFATDYLSALRDRDLRADLFKGFGIAAASLMGAATKSPGGV